MKKYIFSLCALALMSAESHSAAGPVARTGLIPKKDFIRNLIGMSEKEFRRLAGWDEQRGVLTRMQNVQQWIQAYPPRAAVYEGKFTFNTVRDLDKRIKARPMRQLGRPRLRVLVHDPAQPQLTDIAALQADPANYGAVFQIASTPFGPLEGGISKTSSYVESMVDHAVQGEDASISCAGATFWRKYFMPTERRAQGKNGYFNLFHNIRSVPFKKTRMGKPYIDVNDVKKYQYNRDDSKKIGIGIHNDVVVTSGYGRNGDILATPIQNINRNNNPNLIAQRVQRVCQIFTTAYNTKYVRANHIKGSWADFAKVALNGSYEATLKAAYVLGKRRVFLTLMGGGSFRNDMAWIAKALERMAPFIEHAGLDVTLIYRPDKPRNIAVRSSRGDGKFVKKMAEMASRINRRRLPADIDQRIKNYVSGAYQKNRAVSYHAQQLNAVLAQ